ncbi:MAG TPA: hypothetical protein VM221_11260 [Armatimonadota bacterium]|nr:hypothetical protein [Armatimonadota bacterium]
MATRIELKPRKTSVPTSVSALGIYLLDRALVVAAVAVVGAVFYLLAGLVSGGVAAFPQDRSGVALPAAARAHFLDAIRTALIVFMAGLWGVTVVSIFRFRENDVAGYVGGVGGALCYFGLPWLVSASMMRDYANPNQASDLMLAGFRLAGKVLLLITAVHFAGKMVARIANRPSRVRSSAPTIIATRTTEQSADAPPRPPRRSLLRKCWELSLCRENLRENCPSYKLRTTCWKRGTGCQCDPVLAQHLIQDLEARLRGTLPENERLARERMKEQLSYRVATHQGESYCRECPIYGEHQHYKYRAFYWIAYPITAGIMVALLPQINRAYHWLDVTLAAMLSSLSMLPTSEDALRPLLRTVYHFNGEYIFIASVALIIAAYLLDTVDYAVFQAKL